MIKVTTSQNGITTKYSNATGPTSTAPTLNAIDQMRKDLVGLQTQLNNTITSRGNNAQSAISYRAHISVALANNDQKTANADLETAIARENTVKAEDKQIAILTDAIKTKTDQLNQLIAGLDAQTTATMSASDKAIITQAQAQAQATLQSAQAASGTKKTLIYAGIGMGFLLLIGWTISRFRAK